MVENAYCVRGDFHRMKLRSDTRKSTIWMSLSFASSADASSNGTIAGISTERNAKWELRQFHWFYQHQPSIAPHSSRPTREQLRKRSTKLTSPVHRWSGAPIEITYVDFIHNSLCFQCENVCIHRMERIQLHQQWMRTKSSIKQKALV